MLYKLLDNAYRHLWVPIFGRIVFFFAALIEGRKINDLPTYKIKINKARLQSSSVDEKESPPLQ